LADKCEKKAAEKDYRDIKYSKAEVKSIIKTKINDKWQFLRDNEQTGRYLYRIQEKVGKSRNTYRKRQEEEVVSRMRLGLNKTLFIMNNHVDGKYDYCDSQETVEHVIMNCPKYHQAIRKG